LIAAALVLMGTGAGISFVSLTSASLADVASDDAGAASGLINVSQQLGAAVGLAVLVTIFDAATHHGGAALTADVFAHGVRTVCLVGAGFTITTLVLIAALVRPARSRAIDEDVDVDGVFIEDDASAFDNTAVEVA
jgi:MFS family permease